MEWHVTEIRHDTFMVHEQAGDVTTTFGPFHGHSALEDFLAERRRRTTAFREFENGETTEGE